MPYALIEKLRAVYEARFVCSPDSDIVIEGFPRSGNTYAVEFIDYLTEKAGHRLNIAHHTHRVENIQIGVLLNKPVLVLIRNPVDALISYSIYDGTDPRTLSETYIGFYQSVSEFQNDIVISSFDSFTVNINKTIETVNRRFGMKLPLASSHAYAASVVNSRIMERQHRVRSGEDSLRKAGMPVPERSSLRRKIKPIVRDLIGRDARIMEVYREVQSMPDYVGRIARQGLGKN